jgi:hypothetical protein
MFVLEVCAVCGTRVTVHSHKDTDLKDWNHGELTFTLVVRRTKRECGGKPQHYRSDPLPGIDLNRHMMARLRNSMRKHANRTNLDNAAQFGVSDKTVGYVIQEEASAIRKRQRTTDVYEILAFDEKPIRGKAHFVASAPDTTTMILILPTNDSDSIRKELSEFQNRECVRIIITDGTNNYDTLISELYPQALHIRDICHLFRDLHQCREEVRLSEWRNAEGAEKKSLFGKMGFWDKLPEDMNVDLDGQAFLLPRAESLVVKAKRVHRNFYDWMYSAHSAAEAQSLFQFWAESIPKELKPFYEAFIARFDGDPDGFFAYWGSGLTNSPAESVNRNIEDAVYKGRRLSPAGLAAKLTVLEDAKRQMKIAENQGVQLVTNDRQSELSIENSLRRSEMMAERHRRRKEKRAAVAATHDGATQPTELSDPANGSGDLEGRDNASLQDSDLAAPDSGPVREAIPGADEAAHHASSTLQHTQQSSRWRASGTTQAWIPVSLKNETRVSGQGGAPDSEPNAVSDSRRDVISKRVTSDDR